MFVKDMVQIWALHKYYFSPMSPLCIMEIQCCKNPIIIKSPTEM